MSINDQVKRLSKELSSVSKRVVTMHSYDMPRPVMLRVIQSANDALDRSLVEGKVAQEIQTKFQEWYPEGPWHVIVGRDFGSYVTHDEGKFMYFSLGTMIILLFMSKEE